MHLMSPQPFSRLGTIKNLGLMKLTQWNPRWCRSLHPSHRAIAHRTVNAAWHQKNSDLFVQLGHTGENRSGHDLAATPSAIDSIAEIAVGDRRPLRRTVSFNREFEQRRKPALSREFLFERARCGGKE